MWVPVRRKLTLVSVAVICAVSFAFTGLTFWLSRGWIEEDLKGRAITFGREIAATIGDRREFESTELLAQQIQQILVIRGHVAQLDILAFDQDATRLAATSDPRRRLPFAGRDVELARRGEVISRLIAADGERYWEVLAPITLAGSVAGAVAAKFSLEPADRLAARTRTWAFAMTAVAVGVMAALMTLAVRRLVDRPIRGLMDAIARVGGGDRAAAARVDSQDEFGVLARHFNAMVAEINRFNEELQVRIDNATAELGRRYAEVRRLSELLFEAQRRLGQAERLAVAGRIMAEVAHEVGTPLHSVAGHLELLRKELPASRLTADAAKRLAIVEAQVERVTSIIGRRLAQTRRASGAARSVAVDRLVRDTVDLVQPGLAARGLSVTIETGDPGLEVRADRDQLQQVILNLLTNAIDASPAGGVIAVTIGTGPAPGEVVVAVHDTGPGIAADQRGAIFEPFLSTKEPGRGSGLGLFITDQIVREHRGRIEVESEVGKGSTFRVVLPAGQTTGPRT
jgi:signal transduction histidine kinase